MSLLNLFIISKDNFGTKNASVSTDNVFIWLILLNDQIFIKLRKAINYVGTLSDCSLIAVFRSDHIKQFQL